MGGPFVSPPCAMTLARDPVSCPRASLPVSSCLKSRSTHVFSPRPVGVLQGVTRPVCPTQVPQQPPAGRPWLPTFGERDPARSKQASHRIRSLSSWTKCSAGCGSGAGRRGCRLSEKKMRRDRKGERRQKQRHKEEKEGLSQRQRDGQKEEKAETERRTEGKARGA